MENVILEIRAGTGGEEASLFAMDLLKMYSKYAASKKWKVSVLDESRTDLGGLKSAVLEISGENIFSKLQQESGVHRVQRIPKTEKSGRVHTSTASVAVLPEVKEKEIEIKLPDLKIDLFRSSGPGGQNVNKVETAVRLTHLPTGLVVAAQSERTQARNREKAMQILRAKLAQSQKEKVSSAQSDLRRSQIGSAERAEKIRTYNFPQDRITDHRIKKSWHNLESILAGNLDSIIKAFSSANKD